jgi:hypothetical protein
MLIDAKNERVAGWYASYGAVSLLDAPLILVLPLRTIAAALKSAGKIGSAMDRNHPAHDRAKAWMIFCPRPRLSAAYRLHFPPG